MKWNPRGSVWNRWDPHLHAPGTLLEDQFKGDWEAYLSLIEHSKPRIRALGVTDYFSIQAYKEARKRKGSGRLKDVDFLFPNVELRLDMKTAKNHGINVHLLFSPEDPEHENTIERILGRLKFRFNDQDYSCNNDVTGDFCTRWNERESTWYKNRRSRQPPALSARLKCSDKEEVECPQDMAC